MRCFRDRKKFFEMHLSKILVIFYFLLEADPLAIDAYGTTLLYIRADD